MFTFSLNSDCEKNCDLNWNHTLGVGGGGGGEGGCNPYDGLYGKASLERSTFFRLQIYERVGILLVEVYQRVGKSVILVCKRAQKGKQLGEFYFFIKSKSTFFFCD